MAGKASRIYNFCNNQPSPCKCFGNCPNHQQPVPPTRVEAFLKTNNIESGAPFSVCNYGNAFTGVEVFAGEGNGRVNTPVNKDMYFRFASLTKILGMMVLGKAMEDGYITSLDDSITDYITELKDVNGSYIDSSTVRLLDSPTTFDSYGSPKYTFDPPTAFSLNVITIRMLVNMTVGMGYSFIGSGTLRSVLNSCLDPDTADPNFEYLQNICNRNTFIAWLQWFDANPDVMRADTIDSFYQSAPSTDYNITFTQSIINRMTNVPFLFLPGTQTLYDISPSVTGAVVGAAIQNKGINKTSVQYLQERVLTPLGIHSFWFSCGSSQAPANASTNMTDAFFVRNDTYKGTSNPDSDPQPYTNTNGDGNPVVTKNKLYRCSEAAAIGDGFTNQTDLAFFQTSTGLSGGDYLAGGYDWSGCGTLTDFCKLLKCLILKGKNSQGKQVLKPQTVEWILIPKVPAQVYVSNVNGTSVQTVVNNPLWLMGAGTMNFMYDSASWCGAFGKFMPNSPTLSFPCGPSTYYKQSYFGLHYYFDTETGNYMISGTQSPGCSWYPQSDYLTVDPYGLSHNPPYEPDDLTMWNLVCSTI